MLNVLERVWVADEDFVHSCDQLNILQIEGIKVFILPRSIVDEHVVFLKDDLRILSGLAHPYLQI